MAAEHVARPGPATTEHEDTATAASTVLANGHQYGHRYGQMVARELLRINIEGVTQYLE